MINDSGFDRPVFKVLANNDTGAARGHQGGLVIPKELDEFFPRLSGAPTADNPTLDTDIILELWIEDRPIGIVQSRYQFQTWGGLRSPERRLTGGFAAWRNEAAGGDVAVFERSLDNEFYYRLRLYKEGHLPKELAGAVAKRRWGVVNPDLMPASNDEIEATERELLDLAATVDEIFVDRERIASRTQKIARNHAFRSAVLNAYDRKCVITGEAIIAPSGSSSCDAAHIVPVSAGGADIVQNGISLRKDLHWAFDLGLWTFSAEGHFVISEAVSHAHNQLLFSFRGRRMADPFASHLAPSREAIAWHREFRLLW